MVHCESSIERDYVRILDYDTNIIDIIHQPEAIPYRYKGRTRYYYPDFKVLTKTGRVWIVEIKPLKKLREPENVLKNIVGRLYCEKMGWEYRIVTENEIRQGYLQRNLSLIRSLGRQVDSLRSLQYVIEILRQSGNCSIEMLRDNCNGLDTDEFFRALYALIYHKKIYVDLINDELNEYTLLKVNFEER